jgi:asparagine synthase (glutamine-hydrolysing)
MLSADGRLVICYNGEVYNFLELRRELEASGHVFRTDSDTEVILVAWQVWREAMLLRFNGMWALAIYDSVSRELFLARDRFGIKPLLYGMTSDNFVFASEQRALVRSGLLPVDIDSDVAKRLLIDPFSVEASQDSLYRHMHRLQAGHWAKLRDGKLEIRRWWNTVEHLPWVPADSGAQVEQFGALFRDAVSLRMRSDVPIGTCLSGGFDSSAVLCTMSALEQEGGRPRTAASWRHAFVAAFPGMSNDERPQAEEAAAWAGVTPSIIEIGRNDALADVERIMDDLDDVYISLPTAPWQIYRELRRHKVLVSLDGHGADELMGGYRQEGQSFAFHLRNTLASIASHVPMMSRGIDVARAFQLKRRGHYFLRQGPGHLPPMLPLVGDGDVLPEQWGPLNRRLYRMFHGTVLPTILRNFDRLSMAHGVEVRMPFMDWRLVSYVLALPDITKSAGGYSKLVARQAMQGRMPESIRMGKRKVGFNSPMPEWLNGPLGGWVNSLMAQSVPAFADLVNETLLRERVKQLSRQGAWDWESVGRLWPYINLKWCLRSL